MIRKRTTIALAVLVACVIAATTSILQPHLKAGSIPDFICELIMLPGNLIATAFRNHGTASTGFLWRSRFATVVLFAGLAYWVLRLSRFSKDPDEVPQVHVVPPWLRALFLGAVICAVIGPLIGVIALIAINVIRYPSLQMDMNLLKMILFMWPSAIIIAGPGGLVFGALGASWVRFRSRSLPASRRLLLESALLGTVLGGTVPISMIYLDWAARKNVLPIVPLGAVSGLICSFLVVGSLRKRGLLVSSNPKSSN